ncbi:OmpA family protein [Brachybacterium sp. Z12]|uniref:OmpA family protein n=1 Tax=Brachybacterium sp. Z12 TaxID=2759167 RepID=UPI001862A975|nr:OmpA family protein [Brachybacterium sp. Z12]QNN82795.1 OmpA family protein [Brachybacterium sp. Z12]
MTMPDSLRTSAARIAAGSAMLLMLAPLTPPALAENGMNERPEQPFEITEKILADSVTHFDPTASVTSLGSTEPAEDQVIVLETDILFVSNAWDLPSGAATRIAELAAEVPDGATIQVGGHTDSRPVDRSRYDFDNQQLSEHRAQAVADALAGARPDLTLEVEGFGDQDPAVAENPDDPSSFAANRRVELRYGD